MTYRLKLSAITAAFALSLWRLRLTITPSRVRAFGAATGAAIGAVTGR